MHSPKQVKNKLFPISLNLKDPNFEFYNGPLEHRKLSIKKASKQVESNDSSAFNKLISRKSKSPDRNSPKAHKRNFSSFTKNSKLVLLRDKHDRSPKCRNLGKISNSMDLAKEPSRSDSPSSKAKDPTSPKLHQADDKGKEDFAIQLITIKPTVKKPKGSKPSLSCCICF